MDLDPRVYNIVLPRRGNLGEKNKNSNDNSGLNHSHVRINVFRMRQ